MSDLMKKCFRFCMQEEGGAKYTDDPRDPGGPTKYGVALNFSRDKIPDKNKDGKIDAQDIKLLTEDDALKVYSRYYWQPHNCDQLPPGVAFVFADMLYNIGPGNAPRLLQKTLIKLGADLTTDGRIGPLTIKAAKAVDQAILVKTLSADRLAYYKSRKGWVHYGKGWTNRTNRCEQEALKLV